MSTHKSIRNSENAVHETQNHHLVGTYRLGEKYINILNEKSYIATISLPILYRRAVFALLNPPFCSVKEPVLMCKRHCFDAQDRLLGTNHLCFSVECSAHECHEKTKADLTVSLRPST